jgi:hypothetical protein
MVEAAKSFGTAVRDLLIERGTTTALGNPNWSAFAAELPDVSYESLRKAVTGERRPSTKLMETVASALGVEPNVFVEYRLWQAQRAFNPVQVGQSEALRNLARLSGEINKYGKLPASITAEAQRIKELTKSLAVPQSVQQQMAELAKSSLFSEALKGQRGVLAKSSVFPEDLKRQMGALGTAGVLSEDLKRQMSGLATAGVFSEDLKRQMSAVAKSGILSEDLKRQMSGPAKLGVLSEDLKRQMDALAKPFLFSKEMREKIEGLAMSLDPSGGTGRIIREAGASLSGMTFAAASLKVPAGRAVAEAASPLVRQIVDGDSGLAYDKVVRKVPRSERASVASEVAALIAALAYFVALALQNRETEYATAYFTLLAALLPLYSRLRG